MISWKAVSAVLTCWFVGSMAVGFIGLMIIHYPKYLVIALVAALVIGISILMYQSFEEWYG